MDAVKFLEERKRMFKNGTPVPGLNIDTNYDSKKVVKIIEEWSAAHPQKTRQDVFLEQYPDVSLSYGIINIKPCQIVRNHTYGECCITDCPQCRKEFWTQEVE